jgi:hypothetical protein
MYIKALFACAAATALGGCATVTNSGNTLFPETTSKAYIPDQTQTQTLLAALPALVDFRRAVAAAASR